MDPLKDAQGTLNLGKTSDEVNQIASGDSSATDHPKISRDSDNLFSTVEGDTPGPSPSGDDKGTDEQKAEAEKKAADEKAAASAASTDEDRFDKHPRFQELIKGTAELRERLAKAEGMLEATRSPIEAPKPPPAPYKDITQMSDDELREWQVDDPKGYAANLYAQARHELMSEIKGETQKDFQQQGIKKTFDDYAAKHTDFMTMWNSGQIPKFMQDNPGHNAISAHMFIKQTGSLSELEKWHKAEVSKAVKEAEEKVAKNFQAKRSASVLSGATTLPAQSGEDAELKDTQSRGGLINAIAERIQRNRQARGQA
jgi:hypothetical protein